jgi:hypothetical protein
MISPGNQRGVVFRLGGNNGSRTAIHLLLASLLAACRFEPHIATLQVPTLPPQPFGEIVPGDAGSLESPQEAVERLLDELFDPFNMPLDRPYEGTVYQEMDRVLAGAYSCYGYDLAALAAARQDNPLTDEMFEYYLEAQGLEYITDPATGEQMPVHAWMLGGVVHGGPEGPYAAALGKIGNIDTSNPMNFERNYLAALFAVHEEWVVFARDDFRDQLLQLYGNDAAALYEYLLELDLMGTE